MLLLPFFRRVELWPLVARPVSIWFTEATFAGWV